MSRSSLAFRVGVKVRCVAPAVLGPLRPADRVSRAMRGLFARQVITQQSPLARESLLLDLIELRLADRALVEERLRVCDLRGRVALLGDGAHVLVHFGPGRLFLFDR